MKEPEPSLNVLIEKVKSYNPNANTDLIREAYDFASRVHKKQKTFGNELFVNHVVKVAHYIADLELDEETIVGALLHEAIKKGNVDRTEIEEKFGREIAELVDEFTKITEIEEKNREKISEELLSKAILATANDVRSLFVKMATRIASLNQIGFYPENEKKMIANVSLNVYAPICHKLGLGKLEWQLEDLSFKVLHPREYIGIKEKIGKTREEREEDVERIVKKIHGILAGKKINNLIYGRPKHFYGIYKKMKRKSFEEIFDLHGIRIIVNSEEDCYKVLGIIHSQYEFFSEKFEDYIAKPKPNKYRSIHSVIKLGSTLAEVQIRTTEMHLNAEDGLAAHWVYKEIGKDSYFDRKLSWARQLVEWQREKQDSGSLIKSATIGFDERRIFVFTPKNDVIVLPEDSTPLDFAFAIHSDLGHRFKSAKVNGKIVPINYPLQNADSVEIVTAPEQQTKRQWLSFVRLDKAISKIRQRLGIKSAKPKKIKKDIKTTRDRAVFVAQCCNPVPGDEIIGYRTTKRKISVHRANCKNLQKIPERKRIAIEWATGGEYSVELKVSASDRPGLLRELLDKITSSNVKIESTNAKSFPNNTVSCSFRIIIRNAEQLKKIVRDVESIPSVHRVERA